MVEEVKDVSNNKARIILGGFHKLHLHLGVGKGSEKRIVYYRKSAN